MRSNRILLFVLIFLCGSVWAETGSSNKTTHAIGMDFVRLVDNGQYQPDDGMLNFLYQASLTSRTAVQFAAADGDDATVLDLGYKIYTTGYLKGTFWQVGVAYIDVDDSDVYDNDFALTGTLGFEHMPAEHLTVSIGARMTLLVESPATGEKEPFFSPVVAVMYSF